MIINSLCDYYDVLADDAESGISKLGYQEVKASFCAVLNEAGELVDIISFLDVNDKKPKSFITPTSMKKSAIAASPALDRFEYIFGVSASKGTKKIEAIKFKASKELHNALFRDAVSMEARSIVAFFNSWDIDTAWENELILKHYSDKGTPFNGNVVFSISGRIGYLHDCREIVDIWIKENNKKTLEDSQVIGLCCVSGQMSNIARIHPQLSGVKGANATGASLICFKKDSDSSYNLKQSYNSRVGEESTFKYTTVLNRLLSNNSQKLFIGDDTTVFWALSASNIYADIFSQLINFNDNEDDGAARTQVEEQVRTILAEGVKGIYSTPDFDPNTRFCVLGLAPNAGRVSVRYFYKDCFEGYCERIKQHYEDISIYSGEKSRGQVSLSRLLYATISPKSKDKKINPLLGGAVMRAILTGNMYPQLLLNQVILRVKTEAEITHARAAIIKGFIIRKSRILKKEVDLTVALNQETKNPAYVLGRIFALLEMIQKRALGENLNATIKDKYFASACSNPALVFPNLIKLSQHHLAKIEGNYWSIQLGECIALLDGDTFPKTLNMENQGRFILGYYQQNQANYQKKEKNNENS